LHGVKRVVRKMSIFSERLEKLRIDKNISQVVAAKDLEIGIRAYQYYENDEREPRMSVLVRMADYFDVSLDYLTGRTEQE